MAPTAMPRADEDAGARTLPAPARTDIAIMENRPYSRMIGNPAAPYINALARRGMLFTQSYGITHPSQPNYLALFSGSTHGVKGNDYPLQLSGENLVSALLHAGEVVRHLFGVDASGGLYRLRGRRAHRRHLARGAEGQGTGASGIVEIGRISSRRAVSPSAEPVSRALMSVCARHAWPCKGWPSYLSIMRRHSGLNPPITNSQG